MTSTKEYGGGGGGGLTVLHRYSGEDPILPFKEGRRLEIIKVSRITNSASEEQQVFSWVLFWRVTPQMFESKTVTNHKMRDYFQIIQLSEW